MRFTIFLAVAAGASTVTAELDAQARMPADSRIEQSQTRRRAALGIGTTMTGTMRDTLGMLITSITKGSPVERAGLEEGNRISAINGVSLRANPLDVEDDEMGAVLGRRLVREVAKVKAGDEVELRVYRDGRNQTMRIRTADADSLFERRSYAVRVIRSSRAVVDDRPVLGLGVGSGGNRRDTLGVLVMSVADSTPAAKAGIREGDRIAAINGMSLRAAREDADDRAAGELGVGRLQREISKLKPGENVTLRVYSDGKFRDVPMKVARAGDLPRRGGYSDFGEGIEMMGPTPPSTPAHPSPPASSADPLAGVSIHVSPEFRRGLDNLREQVRRIGPRVEVELNRLRPELERLRLSAPRVRVVRVIV